MKQKTKGYVKLSIILYIVILSVALVSTLAWFVFKQSATIETESNSKIVVGEYLEICLDDNKDETEDEWSTKIEPTNIAQFPDVSVTPAGKVWYPKTLDDNDQLVAGAENYVEITGKDIENYLVKIDLKIRSSKAADVYLNNASYVEGISVDENVENGEGTDGKLNKDLIAGASRVAIFENGQASMMWVPNDKYQLVDKDNFKINGTAETEYKYLVNPMTSGTTCQAWEASKVMTGDEALVVGKTIGDCKPILSFTEPGTKKISVYIWVEGTDRESNTIFSGGSLKYNLTFQAVETKSASTYNIDNVIYKDGKLVYADNPEKIVADKEVLYCSENSSNISKWVPYTSDNTEIEGFTKLYIRANETATHKWGTVREITK